MCRLFTTQSPRLHRHRRIERGLLHHARPVRRAARPHAVANGRAVLSRQTAAGYRQRPDHRQRQHHAGRGRDHASDRPGARRDGQPDAERDDRDLAVRRQSGVSPHGRQRQQSAISRTRIPGFRPVHDRLDRRSTTSARSSRSPTLAGRPRTSTSRSRRGAASC